MTTTTKKKGKTKLSESQIRKRAQEIYQERINQNISGNALNDWAQAEKELKKAINPASK